MRPAGEDAVDAEIDARRALLSRHDITRLNSELASSHCPAAGVVLNLKNGVLSLWPRSIVEVHA